MEVEEFELIKKKVNAQTIPVGKGLRITNYIIDLIFLFVLSIIFFLFAPSILGQSTIVYLLELPDLVLGGIIMVLYYFPFELFTSRTLGKIITGTYVVTQTGEKPSLSQFLIRTFSRLIPFEPLSFLFDDRGWHDKISKTFVAKLK